MDIALWVLQAILALKLVSTAFTHGIRQSKPSMKEAIDKMGKTAPILLALTAAGTLVGSLCLILPGLLNWSRWITPFAAAFLAVMLLLSILCHIRSREKPKIFVSLILFAIAAFVAYGRGFLFPG